MLWRMSPPLGFSAECSRMSWRNSGVWLICVWEGKCHHHPWVWETTRTSGVVMIVSLCSMACKEDGFQHFFIMSILPQRENSVVGIFLFLFPVSMFKWKVKEHYFKNEPCLSCILIVPGKDTQSVAKGVWFIRSPNLCLHKESMLVSGHCSPVDIHWFHCGLSRSQDFR